MLPIRSLLLLFFLLPLSAEAFCGLQSCPRVPGPHPGHARAFEAGMRNRWVAYDLSGNAGHYIVLAPRFFYRNAGFAIGAEVPFTRLDNGGAVATGLSNPVLMVQYARRLSMAWSAEIGTQWELPAGDQENGLAGDHHMLMPWIGARRSFGPEWYASAQLGYAHALEASVPDAAPVSARLAKPSHAGHDHDEPVLVNPHADREVQWRTAAGRIRGRLTVEAFALGQLDVTPAGPESYRRAGASCEWKAGAFGAVRVTADFPVSASRRNEAEIGLAFKTGL